MTQGTPLGNNRLQVCNLISDKEIADADAFGLMFPQKRRGVELEIEATAAQ
jgi:hypothetical protein